MIYLCQNIMHKIQEDAAPKLNSGRVFRPRDLGFVLFEFVARI